MGPTVCFPAPPFKRMYGLAVEVSHSPHGHHSMDDVHSHRELCRLVVPPPPDVKPLRGQQTMFRPPHRACIAGESPPSMSYLWVLSRKGNGGFGGVDHNHFMPMISQPTRPTNQLIQAEVP